MVALALIVLSIPATGQTTEAELERREREAVQEREELKKEFMSSQERFELFNKCKPMDVMVQGLASAVTDIGLRRESITAVAESKLRAARLYDDSLLWPYLYVEVRVLRDTRVFSVSVQYRRLLFNRVTSTGGVVSAWERGSFGTGGASFILSNLQQHLDEFLAAYLRVNEPHCGQPGLRER